MIAGVGGVSFVVQKLVAVNMPAKFHRPGRFRRLRTAVV